jgi:hypothetical protein
MDRLVNGQPGVNGWSTFAFAQLAVDHQDIPVLGLTRHQGAVQPPTTSGHPLSGQDQIELGAATLRALGKRVGDTVTARYGRQARRLTIVGTVTLPSIGLTLADHVSLGRGGMLPGSTLLALQGLSAQLTSREEHEATLADPAFPSAVAIDLKPGTSGTALAARIADANPGGDPGGTYRQPRVLGRAIADAAQMGRQPLILALGLAAAVTVSLAAALLASVRLRRPRHALLKALGLTRGQSWSATARLRPPATRRSVRPTAGASRIPACSFRLTAIGACPTVARECRRTGWIDACRAYSQNHYGNGAVRLADAIPVQLQFLGLRFLPADSEPRAIPLPAV